LKCDFSKQFLQGNSSDCLQLQIITGTYAEWLVSYNLLDCHFHTGFDDG
jgi:hypothetical protein